ncbi:MAG: hypothetical protein DWQ01_19610 [Planctomycetota bacterium]|nr:MAG: hypothetical protein DWQ01_19610 [Planctomycetota bacterium]
MGPPVLIAEEPLGDEVAVTADNTGQVHVFASTASRRSFISPELGHWLISESEVVQLPKAHTFGFDQWNEPVGVFADQKGQIHLLVEGKHQIWNQGKWRQGTLSLNHREEGPKPGWAHHGIQLSGSSGVLLAAFRATPGGGPLEWDWEWAHGLVVLPLPVPQAAEKLAVLRFAEDGSQGWAVVDSETKEEAEAFCLVAGPHGRFQLVYVHEANDQGYRLSFLELNGNERSIQGIRLQEVVNPIQVVDRSPGNYRAPLALAHSPRTQASMIALVRPEGILGSAGTAVSRLITNSRIEGPHLLLEQEARDVQLAEGPEEGFQALVLSEETVGGWFSTDRRILYLQFLDGAWSDPVILAEGKALVALVQDGPNRALAVWRSGRGLMARKIYFQQTSPGT